MRRICTIGLTVLLCCQPLLAAAADGAVPAGPLARSVSREALRLAAESSGRAATPDWEALRGLDRGKPVIVTTATATFTGTFVAANDETLSLQDGAATRNVNVEDVLLITGKVRRGSAGAAVLGTLGGIWLGSAMALGLTQNQRCASGCAGVGVAILSAIIGVPIAGGYGAWYQSSRLTEEVIYRRP
jgi:hypothetical protein